MAQTATGSGRALLIAPPPAWLERRCAAAADEGAQRHRSSLVRTTQMSQLPPTYSGPPSPEPSPEPSSEPHLPTCPDTNDDRELPDIGPRARHGRQHPIPETRACTAVRTPATVTVSTPQTAACRQSPARLSTRSSGPCRHRQATAGMRSRPTLTATSSAGTLLVALDGQLAYGSAYPVERRRANRCPFRLRFRRTSTTPLGGCQGTSTITAGRSDPG